MEKETHPPTHTHTPPSVFPCVWHLWSWWTVECVGMVTVLGEPVAPEAGRDGASRRSDPEVAAVLPRVSSILIISDSGVCSLFLWCLCEVVCSTARGGGCVCCIAVGSPSEVAVCLCLCVCHTIFVLISLLSLLFSRAVVDVS